MTSATAPSSFLRYIAPGEAARLIGVTTADIWQLIRAQRLRWRFDPAGRYSYLVAKPDARAYAAMWN